MKENLSQLAAQVRNIRSITVGINLGNSMRPTEAAIVSINTEPYCEKSESIFNKLFANSVDELHGISTLHSAIHSPGYPHDNVAATPHKPLLRELFEDLAEILEKTAKPVQKALQRYIKLNTLLFINIKEELIFYILCARFLNTLKKTGLPITKPEISPSDERIMSIEESYNINLFIRMHKKDATADIRSNIVTNRVRLDADGRIIILTGPNQGGKTVYTQGIGLTQIFFQAGLFVPGTSASISPVDGVYTHFQTREFIANETGRFADEVKRFYKIISGITSHSILLMNESFASTNYTESLFITYDIMKILRVIGLRVVFTTHFHDLALQVNEINQSINGASRLISMVSMVDKKKSTSGEIQRTFTIIPHQPMGKSYAKEVAHKYKIGFHQLLGLLEKRGILRNSGNTE